MFMLSVVLQQYWQHVLSTDNIENNFLLPFPFLFQRALWQVKVSEKLNVFAENCVNFMRRQLLIS